MATTVVLRLRDGRRVLFHRTRDPGKAERWKSDLEQWIEAGMTVSIANARGELEDLVPSTISAIEIVDEPTPTTSSVRQPQPPPE